MGHRGRGNKRKVKKPDPEWAVESSSENEMSDSSLSRKGRMKYNLRGKKKVAEKIHDLAQDVKSDEKMSDSFVSSQDEDYEEPNNQNSIKDHNANVGANLNRQKLEPETMKSSDLLSSTVQQDDVVKKRSRKRRNLEDLSDEDDSKLNADDDPDSRKVTPNLKRRRLFIEATSKQESNVEPSCEAAEIIPTKIPWKYRKYFCELCGKNRSLKERNGHLKRHEKNLVFVCHICKSDLKNAKRLDVHVKACEMLQSGPSPATDSDTVPPIIKSPIAAPSIHVQKRLKLKPYKQKTRKTPTFFCTICGKHRNRSDRSKHMKQHNLDLVLLCPSCKVGLSKNIYKEHVRTCGKVEPGCVLQESDQVFEKIKCQFCPSSFATNANYKAHLERNCKLKPDDFVLPAPNGRKDTNVDKYGRPDQMCEICEKFVRAGNYKEHMEVHKRQGLIPCHVCFEWVKTHLYNAHVNRCLFGDDGDTRCLFCGITFGKLNELNSHLLICKQLRSDPVPCSRCPMKTFKTAHLLRTHRRFHILEDSMKSDLNLVPGMNKCGGLRCPICPNVLEKSLFFDAKNNRHEIKEKFTCLTEVVLYRITCNVPGCEKHSYIGETRRSAFERWMDYKRDWWIGRQREDNFILEDGSRKLQKVVLHFLEDGHDFTNMKFMVIEKASEEAKFRLQRETALINGTGATLNVRQKITPPVKSGPMDNYVVKLK